MTEERASMYEDAPDDAQPSLDPAAKTQPAEGGRDEVADSPEPSGPDAPADVSESGRQSRR